MPNVLLSVPWEIESERWVFLVGAFSRSGFYPASMNYLVAQLHLCFVWLPVAFVCLVAPSHLLVVLTPYFVIYLLLPSLQFQSLTLFWILLMGFLAWRNRRSFSNS